MNGVYFSFKNLPIVVAYRGIEGEQRTGGKRRFLSRCDKGERREFIDIFSFLWPDQSKGDRRSRSHDLFLYSVSLPDVGFRNHNARTQPSFHGNPKNWVILPTSKMPDAYAAGCQ